MSNLDFAWEVCLKSKDGKKLIQAWIGYKSETQIRKSAPASWAVMWARPLHCPNKYYYRDGL